ncbi:MAG: hypothetical protein WCJ57_00885 [Candidatus Falkowbacteria bacterium]
MKRYRRNQEKEISEAEISQNLIGYKTPTPEELFLQRAGQEVIKPQPLKRVIQIIIESFYPQSMPLYYRN